MPEPHIFVVFRNDDPSAMSNLEHEKEIFALFEERGIPQTIGVIPNVCVTPQRDPHGSGERALGDNPEMTAFLREYVHRTGSEVALHGYTHRTDRLSKPSRKDFFEFRGLKLEEQCQMLRQGRDILHQSLGFLPQTFIPPWNELDRNTLFACQREGLKVVSADLYTEPIAGVFCFGVNTDLAGFFQAWAQARTSPGPVFLHVLFHSRTIRTPQEKALLRQILQEVANDPACQAMTLLEAVTKFPEEVRSFNEAGRNVASFHALPGTSRSRTWAYLALIPALGKLTGLNRLGEQAASSFYRGDYAGCWALSQPMDRVASLLLLTCRTSFLLAGLALTLLLVLVLPSFPGLRAWIWLAPTLLLIVGTFVARKAVARDTRQELLLAAVLAFAGGLLGLLFLLFM